MDPRRSPLTGKIVCGHCGLTMRWQPGHSPYHYCIGEKLKKGKGCFEGKVYYDLLQDVVLTAAQAEARKAYDARKSHKQTARSVSSDRNAVFLERKRLTAQVGLLERRCISLYEDFADGNLDRDGYLAAKATYVAELSNAETRIAGLTVQLDSFAVRADIPDNTPVLQRVLDAQDITDEILALIDCVVVYDPSRIEVRFNFKDNNI